MGVMIEHFAGAFPLWLSPVQVRIIPVSEDQHKETISVKERLMAANVRVEADLSSDNFGKRIRNAKTSYIPYFIIIGEKDQAVGKITLESRDAGQIGQLIADEVVERLVMEIKDRK